MSFRFQLAFGWGVAPLANQIAMYGISPKAKDLENWQSAADAIRRLSVHGHLTPRESTKARDRLVRLIERDLVKSGAMTVARDSNGREETLPDTTG